MKAGNSKIEVREFHKGRRDPYPKVIRIYEIQKVELSESKYYLSLYPTESSVLNLQVEHSGVQSLSEPATAESENTITFGPYQNLPPLSFSQVTLSFTFNYAMPYF